uniref:TAF6_C domain-containing protein n=1 Tax=Panagrellus redivivus TaxID=6233 RepID=A0A7E4VN68_PANRE
MHLEEESGKGFIDADFVKTLFDINSKKSISEAINDTALSQLNSILFEVLMKAKDNRTACSRVQISPEDLRIGMRDSGVNIPLSCEVYKVGRANRFTPAFANVKKTAAATMGEIQDAMREMKKPVADVTMLAHWLVIDGVVPNVPENPAVDVAEESFEAAPVVQNHLKRSPSSLLVREAARKLPKTEQVQYKTTTTHALSMEQQVFFKEIMETVIGPDDAKRTEAIHCIRSDTGLQPLLPRFSRAIVDGVRVNLIQENVAFLIYLMRVAEALVLNTHVKIEKVLHDFFPTIISCMVTHVSGDATWALREFCAKLLQRILIRVKDASVKERLVSILVKALYRRDAHPAMIYAIVYTLNLFGADVLENALFPHLEIIAKQISPFLAESKQQNEAGDRSTSNPAKRVHDFTARCIRSYLSSERGREKSNEFRHVFHLFGCR